MNIARIDAATSTVANLEVAAAEWVAANDDNPAHIGLTWEPIGGFEQPPMHESPIKDTDTDRKRNR